MCGAQLTFSLSVAINTQGAYVHVRSLVYVYYTYFTYHLLALHVLDRQGVSTRTKQNFCLSELLNILFAYEHL